MVHLKDHFFLSFGPKKFATNTLVLFPTVIIIVIIIIIIKTFGLYFSFRQLF